MIVTKHDFPDWAHDEFRVREDYPGLMADAEELFRTIDRFPADPWEAIELMEITCMLSIAAKEPITLRRWVPASIRAELLRTLHLDPID